MERIKRNISLFLTELSNCYERIYDISRHSFTPRDSCMQDVSSCDDRATFIFIIYFESPAFEDKYSKRNWHERIVLFKWSIENMSIDEEKRKKKTNTEKKPPTKFDISLTYKQTMCTNPYKNNTNSLWKLDYSKNFEALVLGKFFQGSHVTNEFRITRSILCVILTAF